MCCDNFSTHKVDTFNYNLFKIFNIIYFTIQISNIFLRLWNLLTNIKHPHIRPSKDALNFLLRRIFKSPYTNDCRSKVLPRKTSKNVLIRFSLFWFYLVLEPCRISVRQHFPNIFGAKCCINMKIEVVSSTAHVDDFGALYVISLETWTETRSSPILFTFLTVPVAKCNNISIVNDLLIQREDSRIHKT